MSEAHVETAPADTSEEKDDEEIVALLPPPQPPHDRKSERMAGNNLRRTPGPNNMRRPNDDDEEFHRRTPLVSNSRRINKTAAPQRQVYTPAHFTLSKNPHLHMDGTRPEVFSPNTIRMTDSLDKLLMDDDDADNATTVSTPAGEMTVPGTPQPLKFDGNRGGGAFEPPKPSAMKRPVMHGPPGVDVHSTPKASEGSLHTPKPQRVVAAAGAVTYGRENTQMHQHPHHLPHHMNHYQGNHHHMHPPQQHDHFFTPLAEDPTMGYHDMHHFGPIPPTVVSPLTIPEYHSSYPMHAASWSPIPPEFGMGPQQVVQHPPPPDYHPHPAGYDHHHPYPMSIPHHSQHSQYHLPGNISPFMAHYNMPHPGTQQPLSYQQPPSLSTPLSPSRESQRPRKDSSASVNSVSSRSVGENTSALSPSRLNLQNNSSEEETNWFVPHGGNDSQRGVLNSSSQQHPYSSQLYGETNSSSLAVARDKKLVKKVNTLKQPKGNHKAQQQPHPSKSKTPRYLTATASNQEHFESPSERAKFKEFGRHFRQKENLEAARDYALACLSKSNPDIYLPVSTHWRVYLELADLAKRCNNIENARDCYRKACKLQPLASQSWMEHSKLEEESGNLKKCASIMDEGLRYCSSSENLLIRAIKFRERAGQLDKARQLLGRLKDLPIEKYWKVMMEGALLEARAGKYMTVAREILKYLTHYVSWYGPMYLAHTKLERDYGSVSDAYAIVEKGLRELPRYGPLYFQAFCLLEKEDLSRNAYDLPRVMKMVSRADNNISRELIWKVHLEAAQIQERSAAQQVQNNPKINLDKSLNATRKSYAKAMTLCPPNLCWKIWLASGRTEVSCGKIEEARVLFLRAYDSVSEKGRSTVLLECARLEELCSDLTLARALLTKARSEFGKSDWKVWLASVNLECRCGLVERAVVFLQQSLKIHSGTGRLWASLIQLRHEHGEVQQEIILKSALQAVPKSGEVWCEGARIHLNPFSPTFDLHAAGRHLSFAARFTPQYGDTFLEQLRLSLIDQCLIPIAEPFINDMHTSFLAHGQMSLADAYYFINENTKHAADVVKTQLNKSNDIAKFLHMLDTRELELQCSSADPNYGQVWFQCRNSPIDTAWEVINRAKSILASDIVQYSFVYVGAIVRRAGILLLLNYHDDVIAPSTDSETIELYKLTGLPSPNSNDWDIAVNAQLRKAPSLNEMLKSNLSSQMFITAHVESNRSWKELSQNEKQRILFSDSFRS